MSTGAFQQLMDQELNACLQEMYKQLYPLPVGHVQPYRPTWRARLRGWCWRVRGLLGHPLHWLAAKVSPGGCECEL